MVHAKTYGKDINEVFRRSGGYYPRSFPFFAWVSNVDIGRFRYTLSYQSEYCNGDYYRREDFEPIDDIDNILTPDLFEI